MTRPNDFRALCAEQMADGPAVPESREPASVAGEPSDEQLIEINDGAYCPGIDEVNDEDDSFWQYTIDYIRWLDENGTPQEQGAYVAKGLRAVFEAGRRWGRQPAPPAEREVATLLQWLRNMAGAKLGRDGLYAARTAHLLRQRYPAPPAEEDEGCQPSGYAYRYQSLGSSVIRFNEGGEVNGSRPVEAIPYWLGRPPQPVSPAEGEVAELAKWLRLRNPIDDEGFPDDCAYFDFTRAADLLEQQATAYAICERERLHQSTRAADLEIERPPAPVPAAERLPELRGMFERILCVARSRGQRPVGNIELADRLINAVVSWSALPLPAGEVQ